MAMAQATLATELETVFAGAGTEAGAISLWATGYGNYAAAATALTPILAAGVTLGEAALIANMTGLSTPGFAVTAIAAGLRAFWVAVAGGLATSFAGATAITPPPLTGLEAALTAAFATNNTPAVTRAQAASTCATAIHGVIAGGTVTTAGPIVTPIV